MSDTNGHSRGGRPAKIHDKQRGEVIAIVAAGGSLNDAADVIGVARDTLQLALRNDSGFRTGVDRASAKGKLRLINKVGKSRPWQAAAWMLERKWGAEFGRKVDVEHAGKVDVTLHPAMEKVLGDPQALAAARTLASRMGQEQANGNGHNGNGKH